jgi:hypothetical protein
VFGERLMAEQNGHEAEGLRMLSVSRLLRVLKLSRYTEGSGMLGRTLFKSMPGALPSHPYQERLCIWPGADAYG